MAAAWARHLGGDRIAVVSAGSAPAAGVNAVAVQAMAEVGIDIAGHTPQRFDNETVKGADVVVTMGCGDTCPVFPGVRYEDWPIDDPAVLPLDGVRRVRDELRHRVSDLLGRLGVDIP
jgi:arsenate reductase